MKSPRFRAGGFLCPFVHGGFVRVPAVRPIHWGLLSIFVHSGSVRVSTAQFMRRGFLWAFVRGGFLPSSPSVLRPTALAACWKRGRSVREISPIWKEFFLKFTSGNRDKPVQSSGMEPGVSARRGAASAPLFPYFSIDIAPRARIFLFRLFHGRNYIAFYFQKRIF